MNRLLSLVTFIGLTTTLLAGCGGGDGDEAPVAVVPTPPAFKALAPAMTTRQTFATVTATMSSKRFFHKATLLASGLTLLTGGATATGGTLMILDTAESYGP